MHVIYCNTIQATSTSFYFLSRYIGEVLSEDYTAIMIEQNLSDRMLQQVRRRNGLYVLCRMCASSWLQLINGYKHDKLL